MNAMTRLLPSITTMIRTDHATVLSTFHNYRLDAAPGKKCAIAETIAGAIEIHAQLEEEIFYPAMRRVRPELVDKSGPEHDEMRRHIAQLRALDPSSDAYDATFLALMRAIIHHVADEETALLPEAERSLAGELGELGLRMTRRRIELAAPRAGAMAMNAARSHAGLLATVVTLAAVGGYLAWRESTHHELRRLVSQQRMKRRVQRPAQRLLGMLRLA